MSTEQQQEFSDLWDAQLAQLQATKAELQFTLPLNPSNITLVVEGLINKLKVLAAPFVTTLKLQLEQEGRVIKPEDETLEKIKAEIENELSAACLKYINDNCKLESASMLFEFIDDNKVKGDPDFIRDIKEKALIGLCSTAIEDKQFSSNDAQVEFIQRILTAAETIGSQERIRSVLLPALRDTVNEKLNPAANPFSKVRNAIKLFDHVSSAANGQQIQTPSSLFPK